MCVFFFLFFQIVVVFSASWRRQCGSERVQIALSVPGHGGQAKGKIKICFLLTKVVVVKLFFFLTPIISQVVGYPLTVILILYKHSL